MRCVVIDVDGVLCSWCQPFAKLLRQHGAELRPFTDGEPDCWDWYQAYGADYWAVDAALAHTAQVPDWWRRLPVHADMTPAACDALRYLTRRTEAYAVTARPVGARLATNQWLQQTLGVYDLPAVLTLRRKVQALVALEPAIIIEDRLSTLQAYRGSIPDLGLPPATLILVNRPYNQGDRTGLTVVESTGEALDVALAEGR